MVVEVVEYFNPKVPSLRCWLVEVVVLVVEVAAATVAL